MFEFKRFRIEDSHCGMKVGTDGVLLGAWASVKIGDKVWDVGAGSGVISLMAAQRGASAVTAFELDSMACIDMKANIEASPWKGEVEIIEGDFAAMQNVITDAPDIIISNPPFFNETLHSPEAARRNSRHECTLSITDIMRIASGRLAQGGLLAIIAPINRKEELLFEARLAGLWLTRLAEVVTVEGKQPKRFMAEWTTVDPHRQPSLTTIAIRNRNQLLTTTYIDLVADFYLKL